MNIEKLPVSLLLAEMFLGIGILMMQNMFIALPILFIGFVCLMWSLRDGDETGNMVREGA